MTYSASKGLIGLALLILSGCGETRELTFYLQNLEVNGPVTQPPIYVTREPRENEIHVIPRISIPMQKRIDGRIEGHSAVDNNGVFYVDTVYRQDNGVYFQDPGNVNVHPFTGSNLQWEIPSASIGLDVDIGFSRKTSLAVGATHSSNSGTGIWAYRAGLGFRDRQPGKSIGYRVDLGWMWQEHIYEATTLVTERPLSNSASTAVFYRDREKKTDGHFYGALTLNSVKPEWPINIFFQAGITKQSVTNVKPLTPRSEPWILPPFFLVIPDQSNIIRDLRGEFSATLVHITPGAYFQLSETACVVFGLRISFETGLDRPSPGTIISPVLQLDWEF